MLKKRQQTGGWPAENRWIANAVCRARTLALLVTLLIFITIGACSKPEEEVTDALTPVRVAFSEKHYVEAKRLLDAYLSNNVANPEAHFLRGQLAEVQGDKASALAGYARAIELRHDYIEARLKMAALFLSIGDTRRADEALRLVRNFRPNDAQLLTLEAAIYDRRGETEAAIERAQRLVEQDPRAIEPVLLLNRLYGKGGDWQKGETLLRDALQTNPDKSKLRLGLATNLVNQEKFLEAERILLELIESDPDVVPYQQQLAKLYTEQRRYDEAENLLRKAVQRDPHDERRILVLVQFLAQARGNFAAEQELVNAIFNRPQSYRLRLALGELYEQMLNLDGAARVYSEVAQIAQTGPIAQQGRIRAASVFLRLGDINEATDLINKILQAQPQSLDGLLLRGKIAMVRGDFKRAVEDFRVVLEQRPKSLEILGMIVRAYVASGQSDLAEQGLRRAIEVDRSNVPVRLELIKMLAVQKRLKEAIAEADALLAAVPNDLATMNLKAELLVARSDFKDAEDVAHSIRRLYPDNVQGYLLLGNIHYMQTQYVRAAEAFQQALERFPLDHEALRSLVESIHVTDGRAAALRYVEGFLSAFPNHPTGYNVLGELHMNVGAHTKAEAAFVKAYQLNPTWIDPYKNLAALYQARDEGDAVIQTYLSGLSIIPDSIQLAILLAEAYQQSGKVNDAVDIYEGVLARRPAMDAAANSLAILLVDKLGDSVSIARALELTERFQASPNPAFRDTLGWVYYHGGEVDKAVTILEQVVTQSPSLPISQYHLGMAYLKQGDKSKAKLHLGKAVEMRVPFNGFENAKAVLGQM